MSDSIQNIEASCKCKFKLTELKDLYIKSLEQLNSKTEFSVEDTTSDYEFLLAIPSALIVGTEEYYKAH